MKKLFRTLPFLLLLVLVGANTASAQVAFQMSSLIRNLRVEGTAEAVGPILLTSTTTGTIAVNSTISLDYGTDIVDTPLPLNPATFSAGVGFFGTEVATVAVDATDASAGCTVGDVITAAGGLFGIAAPAAAFIVLTVDGAGKALTLALLEAGLYIVNPPTTNLTRGGTCTTGVTVALTFGAPATNFDVAISGSVLTLTFNRQTVFGAVGYSVVFSGIRVDANSFGLGTIDASGTTTVPAAAAAGNPITFFIINSVAVAEVQPQAAAVSLTPAAEPLSCDPTTGVFSASVTENFNQAFTSATDEQGFGSVGGAGTTVDTMVRFVFSAVPVGLTIALVDFAGSSASLSPATSFTSFTAVSGSQTVVVDVAITAASPFGANETLVVNFTAIAPGLAPGEFAGSVAVSLAGGTAPDVPRFVANTQGSGDVLSTADCRPRLEIEMSQEARPAPAGLCKVPELPAPRVDPRECPGAARRICMLNKPENHSRDPAHLSTRVVQIAQHRHTSMHLRRALSC